MAVCSAPSGSIPAKSPYCHNQHFSGQIGTGAFPHHDHYLPNTPHFPGDVNFLPTKPGPGTTFGVHSVAKHVLQVSTRWWYRWLGDYKQVIAVSVGPGQVLLNPLLMPPQSCNKYIKFVVLCIYKAHGQKPEGTLLVLQKGSQVYVKKLWLADD